LLTFSVCDTANGVGDWSLVSFQLSLPFVAASMPFSAHSFDSSLAPPPVYLPYSVYKFLVKGRKAYSHMAVLST
jgi:hypothetical protein